MQNYLLNSIRFNGISISDIVKIWKYTNIIWLIKLPLGCLISHIMLVYLVSIDTVRHYLLYQHKQLVPPTCAIYSLCHQGCMQFNHGSLASRQPTNKWATTMCRSHTCAFTPLSRGNIFYTWWHDAREKIRFWCTKCWIVLSPMIWCTDRVMSVTKPTDWILIRQGKMKCWDILFMNVDMEKSILLNSMCPIILHNTYHKTHMLPDNKDLIKHHIPNCLVETYHSKTYVQ